ncbi:MAG: type toxin-antitoxin system AbiEi family antitoxin protein, partial [Pseudonocardiales bacterium]|nr:type toxin-antitoxin system AbiEi family antitoxin protein [Pseudonocardiales bacterium]
VSALCGPWPRRYRGQSRAGGLCSPQMHRPCTARPDRPAAGRPGAHPVDMREVPAVAKTQHGVFTTAQARQQGWTDDALRNAVRRKRLVRVQRGCYALRSEGDAPHEERRRDCLQSAVAAALSIPSATVSHQSAAIHWSLPTLFPPDQGCISIAAGSETHASRIHLHRLELPAEHRCQSSAFAITSPARTCLDIACESGASGGIVAADAAVRLALTSRDELERTYCAMYGTPGSIAARQVAQSADGRSESPLESVSRLAFQDASILPEIQQWIYDERESPLARVDFLWPELGVVGEADGRVKYDESGGNEHPVGREAASGTVDRTRAGRRALGLARGVESPASTGQSRPRASSGPSIARRRHRPHLRLWPRNRRHPRYPRTDFGAKAVKERSGLRATAASALTVGLRQQHLADPHRRRRHLDALVLTTEFQ